MELPRLEEWNGPVVSLTLNPDVLLDLFKSDDGLIACVYAGHPDPDAPVNCAPLAHARVSMTRQGSGAFFRRETR